MNRKFVLTAEQSANLRRAVRAITYSALLGAALLLAACGAESAPSADDLYAHATAQAILKGLNDKATLEAQVSARMTALAPTATRPPTNTPTITPTRTPTNTATATSTATPTPSATFTPTPDLLATVSANATLTAITLETDEAQREAERQKTIKAIWSYGPTLFIALCALVLLVVGAVGLWQWVHARAARAGVVETKIGPVFVVNSSSLPRMISPQIAGLLTGAPTPRPYDNSKRDGNSPNEQRALAQVEQQLPIVVRVKNGAHLLERQRVTTVSARSRRNLINLLLLAIKIEGERGTCVPGYRTINAYLARHTPRGGRAESWSGGRWSSTVALVKPHIETSSGNGGGAPLDLEGEYQTLLALYLAVVNGEVKLSAPLPSARALASETNARDLPAIERTERTEPNNANHGGML